MRVRAIVEYLGSSFCGWQWQTDVRTVQGEIERALEVLVRTPQRIAAAGRTDSGVHATGQVVAFEVPDGTDLRRLRRSLNALTDPAICFVDLEETGAAFDPRRHALSRSYEYTIVNARPPSPFLADRSWHVNPRLDLVRLQRLAAMVVGERDFSAFRAADCASVSPQRRVTASEWTRHGDILTYRVTANAFLKQMVRTLVGSMVDVELGFLTEAAFAALLGGAPRERAGRTAPSQGLVLVHVEYADGFGDR